jgi:modulator of FtsH protease HflC
MPRYLAIVAGVSLLALVVILNTAFIVPQDHQAIVRRFGEFTRAINAPGDNEPGLYFKTPFVETVLLYDKRNLSLPIEGQSVFASDQETLIVDAVVRWRIADPRLFYQSVLTESEGEDRLKQFATSAIGRALGGAKSNEIISTRRAELMQNIENDLNADAALKMGVSVIDVRIRQADLPDGTRDRIYVRMRSEREQEAGRIRAEGARAATVIRATAQEQSERLQGEGEAERARIFARAYGRDPEFAAFYRSMRAYDAAIVEGTPIIISPDSDFFRYMQRRRPQ